MPDTLKLLKSVNIAEGQFKGNTLLCWPSVMGNLDLYNDVIFPGAFKKCLADFLRRGFCPRDHEWTWDAIVAMPTVAEERGNKLYSECVFHSDQRSQDALTKCKERLALSLEVGQSIGFSMMSSGYIGFDNGKHLLEYARKKGCDMKLFDVKGISACTEPCCAIIEIEDLWEYSLTPVPANQQAMAVAVKSASGVSLGVRDVQRLSTSRVTRGSNQTMKIKSICGARDIATADLDTNWNAKDAISRIKEHTSAIDEPNAAFSKAFVVCDGPTDEFASYKLPFADVIDGELKVSPKAVFALAAQLDGSRGGVELSDVHHDSAKRFCEAIYAKMATAFKDDSIAAPWSKDTSGTVERWKGLYLGEYVEYDMCMSAICAAWYALYYEISDAISGYGGYREMDDAALFDALSGMQDEFKDLNMAMLRAIMGGMGSETAEQAAASAKRLVLSAMSTTRDLGDGLGYTKQSQIAVDAAETLIERTKDRIAMRRKSGRELSEDNRNTLKDHVAKLEVATAIVKQLLADTDPKANDEEVRALRLQFYRLQVPDLTMTT